MSFNSEGISGNSTVARRGRLSLIADTGGRIGDVSIPNDANESVRTLFEYWLSMSPDGRLPGRRHFDPTDIPYLLPNIWLIDVHRDPMRFWRRLVGTKIEEFAGKSLQGGWVADRLDGDRLSSVNRHLAEVVETRRPSWRRGKSLIQFEKKYSEIERLYLPLAADGETVDMILAISVIFTKDRRWA
ncbi:MAG: PAS domain-containing protein [Rhodospirillaceae bacterium]|nr:PAS domain-containing protein [Rhodospirillaceae bacterium]MDD9926624.1 PAS domain-containing protein [Rhodospirillaceae bacterium]